MVRARSSIPTTSSPETGSHGLRSAWMALAGEDPELIGTVRAYPRDLAADGGARSSGGTGAGQTDGVNGRRDSVRAAT